MSQQFVAIRRKSILTPAGFRKMPSGPIPFRVYSWDSIEEGRQWVRDNLVDADEVQVVPVIGDIAEDKIERGVI